MAVTSQPALFVNGRNLNNWFSSEILWKQTEGLFDGAALEPGATLDTFDGKAKIRAHDMAYQARRLVITGRILNRSGWLDKQRAIADLSEVFAGRPAIVRLGTLELEAEFGPVKLVDDAYSHLPGYQTWRVEGEAVPGTYRSQYHTALGADQGLAVQDDRPDSSAVKFASNSFTYTYPGTAPSEACVALTGTASTTYYLKGKGLRRVPMTTDAAGNAYIDEASGFLVYPGSNAIRVEDSAGALAAGVTGVSLYGTRPRYLGNAPTAATTQSATTNRMSEGPMLTVARTGSATYISTAGTLTTATDGQARIGLPYLVRRNLANSSSHGVIQIGTGTASYGTFTDSRGITHQTHIVSVSGTTLYRKSLPTLPAGTYTLSFFIRRLAGSGTLAVDLSDGASQNVALTPEMTRVSVTLVKGAGAAQIDVFSVTTLTYEIYGWHLDSGTTTTTYQPTNANGVDLTHPSNGAGLVMEGAGSNLLPNSRAQGGSIAGWSTLGAPGGSISAVAGGMMGLGSHRFQQRRPASSSGFHGLLATAITPLFANTTYTLSFVIKWISGSKSVSVYANGNYISGIATMSSAETRVSYTFTTPSSGVNSQVGVFTPDGVPGEGFDISHLQLEPSPVATSIIPNDSTSAIATRAADLCGIVSPHNELLYSHDLTQSSVWTVSGMGQPTKSGDDNTVTFGATTHHVYQAVTPASVASTTRTGVARLKLGTLSGSVLLRLLDQSGNVIASATINTSSLSASEYRTFYVTGTPSASVTGLRVQLVGNSGTGTVLVRSLGLVQGSHTGIEVRTTDTAIPAPADGGLDPAWVQNGYIEATLLPAAITTGANRLLLGAEDVGTVTAAIFRLSRGTSFTTSDHTITFDRKHNSTTGFGSVAGRGRVATNSNTTFFDGAQHKVRLVWKNYTVDGVRSMSQEIWMDDTLIASLDAASLYGATSWQTPDATKLISDGLVNVTLIGLTLGYPTLPSGAIPAI